MVVTGCRVCLQAGGRCFQSGEYCEQKWGWLAKGDVAISGLGVGQVTGSLPRRRRTPSEKSWIACVGPRSREAEEWGFRKLLGLGRLRPGRFQSPQRRENLMGRLLKGLIPEDLRSTDPLTF